MTNAQGANGGPTRQDSRMRIIASARDPGCAWQYKAFVEYCWEQDIPATFCLLAQGAAVGILGQTGQKVWEIVCTGGADSSESMGEVSRLVEDFRPDLALVGLSHPGLGVDETLFEVARSRRLPTAAIQDYWGYTGSFAADNLPDVFLVFDELAKSATLNRTQGKAVCEIVGSPKHYTYKRLVGSLPEKGNDSKLCVVTFFGQPLVIPGVIENLKCFREALAMLPPSVVPRFRPHPKDAEKIEYFEELFRSREDGPAILSTSEPVELALWDSDVVLSCFSSVAIDHHYLQLYASEPIGNVLFVLIGEPIRNFAWSQIGLQCLPSVEAGMGDLVEDPDSLASELLRNAQDASKRIQYMNAVKRNLVNLSDPCRSVWGILKSRVSA